MTTDSTAVSNASADTTDATWRLAPGRITTPWADDVDPSNVLPEHPRPQLVRPDWRSLNGLWDFEIERIRDGKPREAGTILVPFPIESALSGVRRALRPDERLRYRRRVQVPPDWADDRVLLHFGAVDWEAMVRVNGHDVGSHRGGYTPFSFDITDSLIDGAGVIEVDVVDPTSASRNQRGKQRLKPFLLFYTAVSGIWQTVWIERVPRVHVRAQRLVPELDREILSVAVDIAGPAAGVELEVVVQADGEVVGHAAGPVAHPVEVPIPDARLWHPDDPYLYDLTVRLRRGDQILDEYSSYAGMRSFTVERADDGYKRLFLNGRPYFHNGVLDQGYWPDGLYTAPTDDALEADVLLAKRLGFNMIRKHIKVESARWYHHCDRHGMIVWQDMPNGGRGLGFLALLRILRSQTRPDDALHWAGRTSAQNRNDYRRELAEMIDALRNVPSLAVWVPFNESWGQFDAIGAAELTRELDPTRIVDHASGYFDQLYGDLVSIHDYKRTPGVPPPERVRDRAFVLTEYGGLGLRVDGHTWKQGRGFSYRLSPDASTLESEYSELVAQSITDLVGQGLSAVVYTQLVDVEVELNGLATYDRCVEKVDVRRIAEINRALIDALGLPQ